MISLRQINKPVTEISGQVYQSPVTRSQVACQALPDPTLRRRRRICDVCGAFAGHDQPSFPVCGGCDARRYCGEACQIIDWEFRGHARKCQMSADWQEVLDALADDEV